MSRCVLIIIIGILILLITSYQHLIVATNTELTIEKFQTDDFQERLQRLQDLYREGNLTPRAYTDQIGKLESGTTTSTRSPPPPPEHIANITFQTQGKWWIYHNSKYVSSGSPTGANVSKLQIKHVRDNDKIQFRIGGEGRGGLVAQIKIGDKTVVTNSENFTITGQQINVSPDKQRDSVGYSASDYLPEYSGGKYLGCFKDGDPRALPKLMGKSLSLTKCHQLAVDNNTPYYGLQNGGECWIGKTPTKYDELASTRCGERCRTNGNEYCGGPMANQVYSILDGVDIMELPNNSKLGSPNSEIDSSARWVIPRQHDLSDNFPGGVWEFVWTNTAPARIPYCNYPKYSKFQPSACTDPTDSTRCWSSQRPNYEADPDKCGLLFKPKGDYDGPYFFSIINRAYQNKNQSGVNPEGAKNLTSQMQTAYRAACQVILEAKHQSTYDAVCHDISQHPSKNQCDIPVTNRTPVAAVNSKLQESLPGSPDWEQAKLECHGSNGCFESNHQTKPRCYQADLGRRLHSSGGGEAIKDLDHRLHQVKQEYQQGNISTDQYTDKIFQLGLKVQKSPTNLQLDSPSPGFFTAVTKAAGLVNSVNLKYSNATARWKYAMKQLLDTARVVEWDPGNKKGCDCQGNYADPSSLKCFPC